MVHPYRETARPGRSPALTSLTYAPRERMDQRSGCLSALELVGVPAAVGAFVGIGAGAIGGGAVFAILLALMLLRAHRRPKPGALLTIEHGELRVLPRGSGGEPIARVVLENLEDVFLETKTVERVVEGGNANLGLTYLNPRIAPPTDTNRIALRVRGGASVPLTEEFQSHSDTVEWFGKIRVFLRKSGWVPESERTAESGEPTS